MKKKYYYKGKLVRTSENDYKYAVVANYKDSGETFLIACCGNYDLALKRQRSEINYRNDKSIIGNKQLNYQKGLCTIDIVELEVR